MAGGAIMIDERWLRELRVAVPDGNIAGLLGVGFNIVTFRVVGRDGADRLCQFYRNHLGFHINEVSYLVTDAPDYDLGRVNRKLLQLHGDPQIDSMISSYDRLYGKIISVLANGGIKELLDEARSSMGTLVATMSMPFLLGTKAIRRRLTEMASLDAEGQEADIVTVNGPRFALSASRGDLSAWGRSTLELLDRFLEAVSFSGQLDPQARVDLLEDDPVYTWGGAVMDGFFPDSELGGVLQFIEAQFGRLASHDLAYPYSEHAFILSNALLMFVEDSRAERFVKLAAMLGFEFPILDRDGKQVSHGATTRKLPSDQPSLYELMRVEVPRAPAPLPE
jgi:hypothetical protein